MIYRNQQQHQKHPTMIEQSNLVREFMRAFGQKVPTKPAIPSNEIAVLRRSLINEENQELFHAENNVDALDAVCDLLYVVLGAGADYGFSADQIANGFAEVHRSNMSKMWTLAEVESFNHPAVGYSIQHVGQGKYIVKNAEGKVVKSPSYSPADLKGIVEE